MTFHHPIINRVTQSFISKETPEQKERRIQGKEEIYCVLCMSKFTVELYRNHVDSHKRKAKGNIHKQKGYNNNQSIVKQNSQLALYTKGQHKNYMNPEGEQSYLLSTTSQQLQVSLGQPKEKQQDISTKMTYYELQRNQHKRTYSSPFKNNIIPVTSCEDTQSNEQTIINYFDQSQIFKKYDHIPKQTQKRPFQMIIRSKCNSSLNDHQRLSTISELQY